MTAAIWSGGLVTLGIVGATAWLAPRLRQMNLLTLTVSDTVETVSEAASVAPNPS